MHAHASVDISMLTTRARRLVVMARALESRKHVRTHVYAHFFTHVYAQAWPPSVLQIPFMLQHIAYNRILHTTHMSTHTSTHMPPHTPPHMSPHMSAHQAWRRLRDSACCRSRSCWGGRVSSFTVTRRKCSSCSHRLPYTHACTCL